MLERSAVLLGEWAIAYNGPGSHRAKDRLDGADHVEADMEIEPSVPREVGGRRGNVSSSSRRGPYMKKTAMAIVCAVVSFQINMSLYAQELTQISSNDDQARLISVLSLDVINYFGYTEYDTPLKLKVFKNSDEYKMKYAELKSIRAEQLKKEFLVTVSDGMKWAFDVRKEAFPVQFGDYGLSAYDEPRAPKTLFGYCSRLFR